MSTLAASTAFLGLHSSEWWTILIACLCSLSCGVLGCFLVLRRQSLLGDSISHAILPGIALAFLIFATRNPVPMLLGALIAGLLTALLSAALQRFARVPGDAAMGVVFSTFFAIGVILINRTASSVDLDPSCVLYGTLEYAALAEPVRALGLSAPPAAWTLGVTTLVNLVMVAVFLKELRIVSFDAGLARSMGFPAGVINAVFLTLVAATAVASFDSVGSILVVAMLVAPGAAAHMLTDRLGRMLVIAGLVSITAAIVGVRVATIADVSVAGMISAVACALFLLAALLAPRYGIISRAWHRAMLSLRVAREDILGVLYRAQEPREPGDTPPIPHASPIIVRLAERSLLRRRQIVRHGQELALTDSGRAEAERIVRVHRLWESYLASNTPLPLDHLHDPSHMIEHFADPALASELSREVGTRTDPHGRPIP